jgi:hypothetical protein
MGTPYESADLLIKLYDLRREPELRAAREWFFLRFHPTSAAEVFALWMGPESARYRMVVTYWEMAATFVQQGAIDAAMFHAANTEHIALIAKLGPFLPELRRLCGLSDYLTQVEAVVNARPDVEVHLAALRRYMTRKAEEMHPSRRMAPG